MFSNKLQRTIDIVKSNSSFPVLIFPGDAFQVDSRADGILFLSLLSGRNPEYLAGQQVRAAPMVHQSGIEVIPTAYLLVDSGGQTSASYISGTTPLPANKPELAAYTALAGKYMGMKLVYLDAGSGALQPVNNEIIKAVKHLTNLPVIVGGGVNSAEKAKVAFQAGADIVVIGNALEDDRAEALLQDISFILSLKD